MKHPGRLPALSLLALAASGCVPPSRNAHLIPAGGGPSQPAPPPTYLPPPPVAEPLPPPPVVVQAPPAPRPTVRPPVAPPPRPPAPPAPAAMGCGEVSVDGVAVPLDCYTRDYARFDGASRALSRLALATAGSALPEYVDHRHDRIEGPTRQQKSVGDGVAFALAGAIDQALLRAAPGAQPVSALHLWARSPRPLLGPLLSANLGKAVAAEAALPYSDGRACAWGTPESSRDCRPPKSEPPQPGELDRAEQNPLARLTDVVELDGTNIDALRETLAKNQDILLALRVDPDAWKTVLHAQEPDPALPDYVGTSAVQTVTLAGYFRQDNLWYFLVKNSWGPAFGKDGYAWIQQNTLLKNVVAAFVIQAASSSAPAPAALPASCPGGQVPDAVSKLCTPPCPDQSPRTAGVCADPKATSCPPGFVNTTGKCVVAAPTMVGTEPTTRMAYVCRPAGCVYAWRRGSLGCTQEVCSLSCASPTFLASVNLDKKTVACTE